MCIFFWGDTLYILLSMAKFINNICTDVDLENIVHCYHLLTCLYVRNVFVGEYELAVSAWFKAIWLEDIDWKWQGS